MDTSGALKRLLQETANKVCADCAGRNPRFASTTFGVFLCNRCFGVHRSLGTHVTKTRSVSLDKWTNEQIESMERGGNAAAAQIWERSLGPGERPAPECDDWTREGFIRDKYVRRKWYSEPADPLCPKLASNRACSRPSSAQSMASSAACRSQAPRPRTMPTSSHAGVDLPSGARETPCHAGQARGDVSDQANEIGRGEHLMHERASEDPFGLDSVLMPSPDQSSSAQSLGLHRGGDPGGATPMECMISWDPFGSLSSTTEWAGNGGSSFTRGENVKNAFAELDLLFGPVPPARGNCAK